MFIESTRMVKDAECHDAAALLRFLSELDQEHGGMGDIYLRVGSRDVVRVMLYEKTLTDGSKVHDICFGFKL
jgi:hypothetical protein